MYLLFGAPLLSLVIFSIAPIIGGVIGNSSGNKNASRDEDIIKYTLKGIGVGLLIDIPLLCFVLWGFSAQ